MAKNKNPEEEMEEQRPKWVKPENFQKPQQREPRPEWVNPNRMSYRERMDRRLERAGLLNYQTEGLSPEEIAQRYAAANIKISDRSSWFKDNYGFEAPETITNRDAMQAWRKQAFEGNAPSIFPTVPVETGKLVIPSGGNADRPQNFVQAPNGLLVKAPKTMTQPGAVTDSPVAGQVFATNEQALNGEVNWTDLSSTERARMLKDPNFYTSGQITKYPTWMQQQILGDDNFDWNRLPAWQRTYFDLSSSPAAMGAIQGSLMGLGSGSPFGAPVGAVLGWAAGKSGYDATREFWEQDNVTAGAFGLFNWLAEQMEKTAGMGFQIANAAVDKNRSVVDVLNRESWQAGASFLEVITPAWIEAVNTGKGEIGADDLLKAAPGIWALVKVGDLIAHPEKYKGKEYYLGAESPIQIDESWVERIDNARAEIKAGKPYREVMMDMQTGIVAQLGDMAGQAVADPLNFLPNKYNQAAARIAEANGDKVAAAAFRSTEGPVEAGRKYRTLVQTGQALTIDPEFKVDQMGRLSRFIAGVNEQGQVKAGSLVGTQRGLLDPVTGKNKMGWLEDQVTQNPYSRAQTGAGMFYENVSAMMQMFETPEEAAKYLGALSNSDMNTWAELGSRFAESPEFYTVLPALKDFKGSLDGIVQTWEMSAPNRDLLTRIADIMGDQPGTLLEDLARKGTAEQDFQRVMRRLQEIDTPTAKALLADAEAGRFTAETLKQMIDVFTGEGALPWHPGQWKAMMLDQLGDHFDQWVTQRLMLDKSPEAVSAFFRTSALMKQAQSILLLGGSPGYAITNGLSNMVHRAVSGVFGYMTGKQIDTFLDRFGMTPARFDEGVGIGGVVEQAAGKSDVKTSTMDKAVRGKGPLTTAKDALAKLSKGMPFSKLSSYFERNEGRQAFSIAMRDAWSQSWRRGVGFREMSPELVRVLNEMGADPKRIYAAIEAGMNQTEIEHVLMGRRAEVQARSLIHDAAEKTGMSASEAAQMLERIGILDTLDTFLAGQTTRDGVTQAFARAERVAQDWMDMRTGEDLKARAENVKQRVGLEGATAALDVAQKAHAEFTDAWMDHYYRFGEVMQNLLELDDAQRDKALGYAYDVSDKEFRRVDATNAANWQGVFEAWGLSGDVRALRMLEGMGDVGAAMSGAYRQMRENFKAWREKWANDPTNPARWDELTAVRGANDALFKKAFKAKHDAEVKMGAAMAEIYEAQHGPAAGEAARRWWEDVVTFNDEIVKRERDFRGEMAQAARAGVPAELIAVQKQKYYSETKIMLIAELERINSDGIARLERVIKKGGGQSPVSGAPVEPVGPVDGQPVTSQPVTSDQVPVTREPIAPNEPETVSRWVESQYARPAERRNVSTETTPPPTPPQNAGAFGEGSSAVDEVNALMAAAEQRKGREKAESEARKAAVWDVAEEYWGKGGNYNRGILQDGFALVNALRKAEYGGIPDLTWLDDPRLTPELTRQILETRKAAKETSAAAAAEQAFTVTEKNRGRKFDTSQINNDTTILRAVALHGGLSLELAKDITGEAKPKGVPGLFTRKGLGIDEIARMLADDGYPIRLDDPNDIGGMQQTRDLINRARAGDKVYPAGHDFSAEIDAAEAAWIEGFNFDEVPETPFDSALWQTEFDAAVLRADLVQVYEMIGGFPDEMLDSPVNGGRLETVGQTWREFLSWTADEVAIRADENARAESVAMRAAEVQETLTAAETHAEAVTKRTILMESLAEAFKLDENQAAAYGEVSDAVADWYARMTGETRDDFYNRYFGDVKRGGSSVDDALMQRATQQGLWSAGEDTPLFSGTAQRVQLDEFKPVTEKVEQGNLFDVSQETPAPKPEPTPRTRTPKEPRGLQDFGEKLGGARKDLAKQQFVERNLSDADLAKMSLSEIWAKSEVDGIEEPNLAALATALRSAIPSKPKSGWKLSRWVEQVKTIRDLVKLSGEKGVDYVVDSMRANVALRPFADKVSLMQEFPRESWGRIGEVRYSPDAYTFENGKKVAKPFGSATVDGKTVWAESWSGLVEEVRTRLKVEKDAAAMNFEVRRSGKEYFVNKKGDPLYRKLKTFTSSDDAFAFIRESRDELVKAWDGVKESDNVKETDVRREENRERAGRDHREGKDATPDMFLDRFGFRGVEFGNWVSQGGNIRERQGMLNAAYDALMDLSDVLGVPPKALSLDGELGLGMGSRGSGSASAHYEPSYVVINLTKTRGAGTLAHEWFHALDNYFQKKRGYVGNDKHGGAFITYQPETHYRNPNNRQTMAVDRFEYLKERGAVRNPDQWVKVEGVRPEVEQSFADLVKTLNESPMRQRAEMIDKGQSAGYWSRVIERGARSFENYVIEKMAQMGYENDYLANVANLEQFNRNPERYPYLRPEEVAPVVDAFDKLFSTIKTRETAKGVELYQSIPGMIDKGMVTFEEMKATITAFEAADFSTVIHESGHVYRKVLKDVAERTGNPYIMRDLTTIEEWAGVTDGKWTREAEEKFARGFERYITEGNAPTPKLVQAFESFRQWMLDVYKAITGSSIDVKLTDEVRQVFDRMLGQEEQVAAGFDPETQWVDTNGRVHMKKRAELDVDPNAARADARALLEGDMGARLRAAAEARRNRANPTPSPSPSLRDGEGSNVDALFQSEVPFGMYDEKAQFRPASDGMDATWRERVMPLLRAMEEGARDQVSGVRLQGEGAFKDMSPEGQAMLKKYMQQVKGDMATTKLATVRFAEKQRDFALLNYSKRYGYDRMGDFLATYQLYPTRSMVNWFARVVDKPALFADYARLRMQNDRYERDIPERLRGKIRISAPWLPEWAGDSLYIDPLRNLFFPDTVARFFERAQRDKSYQVIEAERVLQEWQADGQYSDAEIIEAAKTQKGKVWERAWEEAQLRRESESSNQVDFFTSFFGPSWYISTPLNYAGIRVPGLSKGDPSKVNTLPLGNTARALDTVTQGTWAEPFGDLIGLIGKGEDAIRETFKLPTRGEYAEYYTKRQVANMVAEGRISPEDAQLAMIEKAGPIWEEAKQRVDMELALRVPLAGVTYAALHEGPLAGAQAAVPSLFGASLLPAGELEFRGLKDEWDEAWKLADAGDTKAVQRFFDNYPEYEAYLAKNKDDGELLRSFLIGQIWDAYMELGTTNQKQARAELGEEFRQSFLDKETRSYEALDVNQLAEWARLLGARVPTPSTPLSASQTSPQLQQPQLGGETPKMQLYPEDVTGITDQFFQQRTEKFPNYYEDQAGYYALPKSERKKYLLEHPNLQAYWNWKDGWYRAYPQFVPIFNGDAFDRVDTSGWMPGLEDAVREAAMSGGRLGQGARAALMNEWLLAGQPMGNFDTWVKSVVMPGMMYGNGE